MHLWRKLSETNERRGRGGGGGWKWRDAASKEVGGSVLMRDEWGPKRTWRGLSYIMRNASVTKPCEKNTPIKIKLASSKSQIWEDGPWSNPSFLLSPVWGFKSFSLSAGWTSEEEGWWLASILMFNPISVSTPDKPLLPVIHHLRNNGTPPTLINNINLPCPLRRSMRHARAAAVVMQSQSI